MGKCEIKFAHRAKFLENLRKSRNRVVKNIIPVYKHHEAVKWLGDKLEETPWGEVGLQAKYDKIEHTIKEAVKTFRKQK